MLMPFVLSREEIGALSLLDSVSNLFAAFCSLGFAQISYQLYARFRRTDSNDSGLLRFGVYLSLIGSATGVIIYLIGHEYILGPEGVKSPLREIALFIAVILVCKVLFRNIDAYLRMSFRSVIGALMESFIAKLIVLSGIVLIAFELISFNALAVIYSVGICTPGLVLLIVALRDSNFRNQPKELFAQPDGKKHLYRNGIFGLIATGSSVLVLSIDQIMLVNIDSLSEVGVYSILFFAGMIVNVPSRGIKRISIAVLGKAWKTNDRETLRKVYHKSHITSFLSGVMLLCIGWLCLDDALVYLPEYAHGSLVFLFIGLGQLIEMSTGSNQELIAASDKYEYNTYLTVFLGVTICLSNFALIPDYGVIGAALASCISIALVNILRLFLVWRLFDLQPFNQKSLIALMISMPLVVFAYWDPLNFHPLFNIVLNVFTVGICFPFIVFRSKVSEDSNRFIGGIVKRLGKP